MRPTKRSAEAERRRLRGATRGQRLLRRAARGGGSGGAARAGRRQAQRDAEAEAAARRARRRRSARANGGGGDAAAGAGRRRPGPPLTAVACELLELLSSPKKTRVWGSRRQNSCDRSSEPPFPFMNVCASPAPTGDNHSSGTGGAGMGMGALRAPLKTLHVRYYIEAYPQHFRLTEDPPQVVYLPAVAAGPSLDPKPAKVEQQSAGQPPRSSDRAARAADVLCQRHRGDNCCEGECASVRRQAERPRARDRRVRAARRR